MKKARNRQRGKSYTISCTAEQFEAIEAGAIGAGMSVSAWFVACALTVDPWPKAHRRLVLEGKEQRYISRSAGELARGLHSEGGMSSQLADDHSVLLEARLETMVGQGRGDEATTLLRTVFGEERAEVIAAAFISETPLPTESPEGPEDDDIVEGPGEGETEEGPGEDGTEQDETEETPERDRPLQPDLF